MEGLKIPVAMAVRSLVAVLWTLVVGSVLVVPTGELGAAQRSLALAGEQNWLTILCRFDGHSAPHPPQFYDDVLWGTKPDGVTRYWEAMSYGSLHITGGDNTGWLQLSGQEGAYNRITLQRECATLAHASFPLTRYDGLLMFISGELDGSASASPGFPISLPGRVLTMPIVQVPNSAAAATGVIQHEIGHVLGLQHLMGPDARPYTSRWGPMGSPVTPPPSLIAYHRWLLGWIADSRTVSIAPGIEPGSFRVVPWQAPNSENPMLLMVRSRTEVNVFFTAEVRSRTSYDFDLPGEGVVIHKVSGGPASVHQGLPADTPLAFTMDGVERRPERRRRNLDCRRDISRRSPWSGDSGRWKQRWRLRD